MHRKFSEAGGSKVANTPRGEIFIDVARSAPPQRVDRDNLMEGSNNRKRVGAEASEAVICGDNDASPTSINFPVPKDPFTSPIGAMATMDTSKCLSLHQKHCR